MLGKTDLKTIIALLDKSQRVIEANCSKPVDLDVARRCRKMARKLERSLK